LVYARIASRIWEEEGYLEPIARDVVEDCKNDFLSTNKKVYTVYGIQYTETENFESKGKLVI